MDDVLPWPLMTIDFEASSLDEGTYPIEVGVCRWTSPDATIEGWSTLIAPIPAWCDHGSWSPSSQEVHGIKPEELAAGMSPTEAIAALNAITGGLRHSATAAVMTSIGKDVGERLRRSTHLGNRRLRPCRDAARPARLRAHGRMVRPGETAASRTG